jgi:dihydroorotate dehydrogenase electron transfer subunit
MFACTDDFRKAGCDVHRATLDGSTGTKGTVVDLLEQTFAAGVDPTTTQIACCGPEPMMEAVAGWAATRRIRCEVSLETPMACGIGICFTCVARIRDQDGDWDYRRTCVEGPVFDAARVVW